MIFLDQLCTFYGSIYEGSSSVDSEVLQSFSEKVYELAGANGLPSEGFKLALSGISLNTSRSHWEKVHDLQYLSEHGSNIPLSLLMLIFLHEWIDYFKNYFFERIDYFLNGLVISELHEWIVNCLVQCSISRHRNMCLECFYLCHLV